MAANPYSKLPAQAYWRTGIAKHSGTARPIPKLWVPDSGISRSDSFLTVGSCFAQHIGNALTAAGLNRMIVEQAPAFLSRSLQAEFGYGIFSFRIGNVYTASMLLQWLKWVTDPSSQDREIWKSEDGYVDPVRPGIEPGGFETDGDLFDARNATFAAFRQGIQSADTFIFTLGLTETWTNAKTGLVYASCPGTQSGSFDGEQHCFVNATVLDVIAELTEIRRILRSINPDIRMLLTVSPVPLAATAVLGAHVLVSTVYSKSVLRAAAGQMAATHEDIDYFPSYEIVSHPAIGQRMFEEDQREVRPEAVSFVMQHFLAGLGVSEPLRNAPAEAENADINKRIDDALAQGDAVCDEAELDKFNEN